MKLAIIAEYDPELEPHVFTDEAIQHSADALGIEVVADWKSTEGLTVQQLHSYDAIWVGPGSPYRSLDNAVAAIRYARENSVPLLGTCGGFQHMLIEYARSVLRIPDADHEEYDPYASKLIVSKLACSLVGREMEITFSPSSLAADAYGSDRALERYYCNFAVNPEFIQPLTSAGFTNVGTDQDGECRVMEVAGHPFFVGTLFVPQARSRPASPHPLINRFLREAAERGNPAKKET